MEKSQDKSQSSQKKIQSPSVAKSSEETSPVVLSGDSPKASAQSESSSSTVGLSEKATQAEKTVPISEEKNSHRATSPEEKKTAEEESHTTRATQESTSKADDLSTNPPRSSAETEEEKTDVWTYDHSRKFAQNYAKDAHKSMSEAYVATVQEIQEQKVVSGVIIHLTDKYVVVNIGYKSDGFLHRSEFRDTREEPKVGDIVEVFVEKYEDAEGNLLISRHKARMIRSWECIQDSYDQNSVLEGKVKRRTKGGLILNIFGIEAFLPGSQVDIKPVRDFDSYVGKTIEVKVVKINYANDNVVVSHKMLIEKDIEQQKAEILSNLEKGQVLEGVVKNITKFGAFIDLGGIDGLLHITDIAWGRIGTPQELLEIGQEVNVVVLGFDDEKKRISLGMKQLEPHPWDVIKDYEIGQKIKGEIVNVTDYGAFLKVAKGVEGLIHVSEMSWSQHLRSTEEFIKVGEEVEVIILSIDKEEHKMALSLRRMTQDPWQQQDLLSKYASRTKHVGIVRNLTNYGLFLELEEGIDGLVHVSDLSWTKKIRHPADFVKAGEKLEVVVLEVDSDNRKLALSHKHLEKNPWDELESIFKRGSTHKCTITKRADKVAILELPYGLEGICYLKNLLKEDKTTAQEGETLPFVVTEFFKDDKRIVLSHKHTFQQSNKNGTKSKKDSDPAVRRILSEMSQSIEKVELGELESLSSLKELQEKDAAKEKSQTSSSKETNASDKKEKTKPESDTENKTKPDK